MKLILCIGFVAALGACGKKENAAPPATSTDCAHAMSRIDELRMKDEHATPEQIQTLKEQRAKSADADINACTKNQTHAWAECVVAATTSKDATSCK